LANVVFCVGAPFKYFPSTDTVSPGVAVLGLSDNEIELCVVGGETVVVVRS
jgi:hypothetical protein